VCARNRDELARVKARLASLSTALPELIGRVREVSEAHGRPVAADLPDAQHEGQRLAAFGAYLAHYGRVGNETVGPLDVGDVLAEAVALARGELEPRAQISTSFAAAPLVRANRRQLGQVFVSLLINAAQALPAGARDDHEVAIELDTSDAGAARVAIADTGPGIAPELLTHIFEPLYSTKRGAGMGIGLAIVREIVESLGGRVTVESELGRGTIFVLELPAAS
jgi:signal transduction histidine kinase